MMLGCKPESEQKQYTDATVIPVYAYMRDYFAKDSARADAIYQRDSAEINAFMRTVSELKVDNELIEGWAASQAVAMFTPAVDSVFTDSAYVGRTLGHILGSARDAGLQLPHRRYATVVYGRPESILFVDSVMLIALNHYLGADFEAYSHWPAYRRAAKTPENLPYDMAEALVATRYPYQASAEQATLLSRMLYEGTLAHLKEQIVPKGNAAAALGYTDDEYRRLIENESALWQAIISEQLLYDTSEITIDRLTAPSPATTIGNISAPGRVARFIGYRIVEAYLKKHPGVRAADMLDPAVYNASSTLPDSQYN